jgi:hypothetical protein
MDLILIRHSKKEIIGKCPNCKSLKHTSRCNLKINPLKHYMGIAPLWLCYRNEYRVSRISQNSIRFAEMLATAWNGIEP